MANTAAALVHRIENKDPTLQTIVVRREVRVGSRSGDDEKRLVYALMKLQPPVRAVSIASANLGDEEFSRIAQHIAANQDLSHLNLSDNNATHLGFLAIAAALYKHTCLRSLYLYDNKNVSTVTINRAFIVALRLNPGLYVSPCLWYLHNAYETDARRLSFFAEKFAPPSMLEFLLQTH